MKELVVISGKGGTGKTSVVAALAALAENKLLADCDVDAANLHLVLKPRIRQREDFSGGKCARIDPVACTVCGKCWEVCRYDAVRMTDVGGEKTFRIDPLACEGCGVCAHFCPTGAMVFEPVVNGQWFVSDTRHGPLIHARLSAGGENSGRLVTLIRQQARRIAEDQNLGLVIVDGSPGIGCPVIASLTGADLALVVTEPTLAGIHDFGRITALTNHFSVPVVLCINKWDLNPELTQRLEQEAHQRQISVVGRVRYSPAFTQAQRSGISVVEYDGEPAGEDLWALWQNLKPFVIEEELTLKLL